ncbi:MAG: hypothetical protein GY751_18495 [Bacteroidetes bacterium]|nr:hypothetical protein [Bacteroidota bacterium]
MPSPIFFGNKTYAYHVEIYISYNQLYSFDVNVHTFLVCDCGALNNGACDDFGDNGVYGDDASPHTDGYSDKRNPHQYGYDTQKKPKP